MTSKQEQLASLLETPNWQNFQKLATLINEAPKKDFEVLIEQAEKGLEAWPDRARPLSLGRGEVTCPEEGRCELRLGRSVQRTGMREEEVSAITTILDKATKVTDVFLRGKFGKGGFKQIMMHQGLSHLRSLEIHGLGNAGVKTLTKATHLTNLRSLQLERGKINAKAIAEIEKAPHLHVLETLSLKDNKTFKDEGVQALLGVNCFPALRTLRLGQTKLTSSGMKALEMSACRHWQGQPVSRRCGRSD